MSHFRSEFLCRRSVASTIAALVVASSATSQATWREASTLKGPPARMDHAMAYDSDRGVVVLFGGQTFSHPVMTQTSDTWEWDGYLWTQKTPRLRPKARAGAAMVYDPKGKRMLLFGGHNGSATFADTWSWDGSTWKALAPTNNPPPRTSHAMCMDTKRSVVVMHGGTKKPEVRTNLFADTWEFNGTTWVNKAPTTSGLAVFNHALAFDASRNQTLLLSSYLGETWIWSGSTWSKRSPTHSPQGYYGGALAYDSVRKRVVAFAGSISSNSSRSTNSVLEWDGGDWVSLAATNPPTVRMYHSMVYDSGSRRMVVFGGWTAIATSLTDTWELIHDCFCVGEGHAGGGLPIACLSAPVLGSMFRIAFSTGLGKSSMLFVGPVPAIKPLVLSVPLVCTAGSLYVLPMISFPSIGTPSRITFQLPNDPKLAGIRLIFQGAAKQPFACFLLTDAIETTFRFK